MSNIHGKANVFAMPQPSPRITQERLRDLRMERERHRIDGQVIEREALEIAELLGRGAIIEPGPSRFDADTLEVIPRDRHA